MKRIITLILFLFIATGVFAQTDGITYQAVIIGPDALELPGVDSPDNYLPTTDIAIKFSIIAPGSGVVEFTEIQNTTTDEFGRINLIIGAENHDDFEKIDWNGDPKSLKVEVDFNNGDGFVDMSVEKLTYVPYVAHRDITATGTLEVDDDTFLNRELTVNGPTTINSTLNIADGNPANLTGDLNVDGETNLNNTFNVTGQSASNLSGALNVGDPLIGPPDGDPNAPTTLNGSLTVVGESTFTGLVADDLTINESTLLKGSVEVDSDSQIRLFSNVHTDAIAYRETIDDEDDFADQKQQVDGVDPGLNIANYPVLVEGSSQGIAIKVNQYSRNGNNFVSFWDNSNTMKGRIEGEIDGEFANNADYIFDQGSLEYDIYDAWVDYSFAVLDGAKAGWDLGAALADVRPCAGLGACVTSPGWGVVAYAAAVVVVEAGKIVTSSIAVGKANDYKNLYDNNKIRYQGVTYASGAGDYAEYLQRANSNEKMTFGDIVGVKGGKISKNTADSERMMVISLKPIVLGNMPVKNYESNYEKVAFMGQVPVKVFGKVNIGDYIIPSGKNDGIGVAIAPSLITTKDVKKIVGIAWESSNNITGFNVVNTAVGLNTNDNNPIIENLETKVNKQELQIEQLKSQISDILSIVKELKQNKIKASLIASDDTDENTEFKAVNDERKYDVVDTDHGEIIYFKVERKDFDYGFELAEKNLREDGYDIDNDVFWNKVKTEPDFKNKLIDKLMQRFDKQMHYHKQIDKKKRHK
ncbi:hypothetical protein EYD45_06210 [Hyunsoonleella flava]|uniref:Peptidase G2 IMC autoproteolytic cleavage domain-containing protein n=1 Tax=Hyunsoonleella flava TaxID=2527939 RepID=A0A4Q9FG92_9FLAO|nr:peptidase G2 autoproteolytic cleavage domain-containing protein [Hyunsoonleella flava]TBN04850.1 hypothetical protein EYD45_06210 [Hyunsoonleella flava]